MEFKIGDKFVKDFEVDEKKYWDSQIVPRIIIQYT